MNVKIQASYRCADPCARQLKSGKPRMRNIPTSIFVMYTGRGLAGLWRVVGSLTLVAVVDANFALAVSEDEASLSRGMIQCEEVMNLHLGTRCVGPWDFL